MCKQSWKISLIVIVKSPVCKVLLFRFHYFFFKESSTFTSMYNRLLNIISIRIKIMKFYEKITQRKKEIKQLSNYSA